MGTASEQVEIGTAVATRDTGGGDAEMVPRHDVLAVIERLASDPAVDIDRIERLIAMQERLQARAAETAYWSAMSECQAEMAPVARDAANDQTRSRYATHDALDRALRPIYTRNGFAVSYAEDDCPAGDTTRVVIRVGHIGGHVESYHMDVPWPTKGPKGNDVMTRTHGAGAAGSYGMRYLLRRTFAIALGEEDTDGNAPAEPITEKQAAGLKSLAEEIGADTPKAFLEWLGVRSFGEIPADRYGDALAALERKRGRR